MCIYIYICISITWPKKTSSGSEFVAFQVLPHGGPSLLPGSPIFGPWNWSPSKVSIDCCEYKGCRPALRRSLGSCHPKNRTKKSPPGKSVVSWKTRFRHEPSLGFFSIPFQTIPPKDQSIFASCNLRSIFWRIPRFPWYKTMKTHFKWSVVVDWFVCFQSL